MKIRPCIDIHNGKVKQIVGSTLSDDPSNGPGENFVSALGAAGYAAMYRGMGLSGGHVILLNPSGTAEYEADRKEALSALSEYPGGMQAGGGITPENAGQFLDAGASHVIVTSYVFRDGILDRERLERMKGSVGKDRLVLDLSCRRREDGSYAVVTDRWQRMTELVIGEETLEDLSRECDEFLIHAADVEGRKSGIETDLVALLGKWQDRSGFPVTYAGGVHAMEDLDVIRKLSGGRMDVTVGSALKIFGGTLELDALSAACRAE